LKSSPEDAGADLLQLRVEAEEAIPRSVNRAPTPFDMSNTKTAAHAVIVIDAINDNPTRLIELVEFPLPVNKNI
jgi:hypothetical protein